MPQEIQESDLVRHGFFARSSSQKGTSLKVGMAHAVTKDESTEIYQIPKLETLNSLADELKRMLQADIDFVEVAIVAVQHNLETTGTLYDAAMRLGVKNIYSLGKCYSDSKIIIQAMRDRGIHVIAGTKPEKPGQYQEVAKEDIKRLWQLFIDDTKTKDIKIVIILDDGGRCLAGTPPSIRYGKYKVAGIEQTRGGLYLEEIGLLPFPVIEVASSALKKQIEPPFIAKAITRKVDQLIESGRISQNVETLIGVIGNGAIGNAIVSRLLRHGYRVLIYDENDDAFQKMSHERLYRVPSIRQMVSSARYIFSCTGKDVTAGISLLSMVNDDTVFISCSSEDKEFLSALREIVIGYSLNSDGLFDLIATCQGGKKATFARSGFPINFDNEPWNVPAEEIEPTQAALFSAIVQAILSAKEAAGDGFTPNKHERLMLSPELQKIVVSKWRTSKAASEHDKSLLDCFKSTEWICKNSGGEYREYAVLKRLNVITIEQADSQDIRHSQFRSRL